MTEALFSTGNYVLGKKMLDVTDIRQKMLAGNLANVETPGYKRMDVSADFQSQLVRAVHKGDFSEVRSLAPKIAEDKTAQAMRADGNNVEVDKELLYINQNALQYEFLTQYVSNNLKSLNKAIRGQISN